MKDISLSWFLQPTLAVITGASEILRQATDLSNTLDKYSQVVKHLIEAEGLKLWHILKAVNAQKDSCKACWDKEAGDGWCKGQSYLLEASLLYSLPHDHTWLFQSQHQRICLLSLLYLQTFRKSCSLLVGFLVRSHSSRIILKSNLKISWFDEP